MAPTTRNKNSMMKPSKKPTKKPTKKPPKKHTKKSMSNKKELHEKAVKHAYGTSNGVKKNKGTLFRLGIMTHLEKNK